MGQSVGARISAIRDNMPRYIKNYLRATIGYPYFEPTYVDQHIDLPGTDPIELQEYRSTHSTNTAFISNLLVVLSLIAFLRSMPFATVHLFGLNHRNISQNIMRLSPSHYRFDCLVSNCSRIELPEESGTSGLDTLNGWMSSLLTALRALDPEWTSSLQQTKPSDDRQLAEALIELPVFTFCHKIMAFIQDISQYFGYLGMMLGASLGSTAVLSGCLLTFMQRMRPTGNTYLMFLVAPKVTRQVVHDRAKQLINQIADSFQNFHKDLLLTTERRLDKLDQLSNAQLSNPMGLADIRNRAHLSSRERSQRGSPGYLEQMHNFSGTAVAAARKELRPDQYITEEMVSLGLRSSCKQVPQLTVTPASSLATRFRYRGYSQLLKSSRLTAADATDNDKEYCNSMQCGVNSLYDSQCKDEFASDCISIMRSDWWLNRATNQLFYLSLFTIALNAGVGIISAVTSYLYVDIIEARVNSIGTNVRRANCSIWLLDESDDSTTGHVRWAVPGEVLNLATYKLERNLLSIMSLLQYCLPFTTGYLFVATYFLISVDITFWLYEIKFQLLVSIEFAKQLLSDQLKFDQNVSSSSNNNGSRLGVAVDNDTGGGCDQMESKQMSLVNCASYHHGFRMATWRKAFERLPWIWFMLAYNSLLGNNNRPTESKFESTLAIEAFVSKTIQAERLNANSFVELLEKLYIGFRIFVEQVHHCDSTMGHMIVYVNLFTYIYVIIGASYLRLVSDFTYPPIALIIYGGVLSIFFILPAANFHAKGKELHSLIWQLLAATSQYDDIRIRHMHHLWLRQVLALDMDRGLALAAFGIRITYVRIIQLILSSGTLLVFALRL